MAKPVEVLRDGRLKAAIWRVEANNVFYTVSLSRVFQDNATTGVDEIHLHR